MVSGWLNWVNATVSIPLALLGFSLAIWQSVEAKKSADQAKTAAEAAKEAAEESRAQFRLLSAASLLPQLLRLEESIERAIEKKSTDLLSHSVASWRWQAGMCRGYLDGGSAEETAVMTNIQKSIVAVGQLKESIMDFGVSTDWPKETKKARRSIGAVTQELGALAAQQTAKEQ